MDFLEFDSSLWTQKFTSYFPCYFSNFLMICTHRRRTPVQRWSWRSIALQDRVALVKTSGLQPFEVCSHVPISKNNGF